MSRLCRCFPFQIILRGELIMLRRGCFSLNFVRLVPFMYISYFLEDFTYILPTFIGLCQTRHLFLDILADRRRSFLCQLRSARALSLASICRCQTRRICSDNVTAVACPDYLIVRQLVGEAHNFAPDNGDVTNFMHALGNVVGRGWTISKFILNRVYF